MNRMNRYIGRHHTCRLGNVETDIVRRVETRLAAVHPRPGSRPDSQPVVLAADDDENDLELID
jgi:hypothetical protein